MLRFDFNSFKFFFCVCVARSFQKVSLTMVIECGPTKHFLLLLLLLPLPVLDTKHVRQVHSSGHVLFTYYIDTSIPISINFN